VGENTRVVCFASHCVFMSQITAGIFNNIRRSAFMQRPSSIKDSSRESVANKVFVETEFFSDDVRCNPVAQPERIDQTHTVPELKSGNRPYSGKQYSHPRSVQRCESKDIEPAPSVHESISGESISEMMTSAVPNFEGILSVLNCIESARLLSGGKGDKNSQSTIQERVQESNAEEYAHTEDGLTARKALFQQVVASWHGENRLFALSVDLCQP
jgi:hypothetical protein